MGESIELNDAELDAVAGGVSLDGVASAVGGALGAVGAAASDAMNSASDAMSSISETMMGNLAHSMRSAMADLSNVVDGIGQGDVGGYV